MLLDAEKEGNDCIVSWQPHRKAFRVHRPEEFSQWIMPRYFKQTKYKSFQRQLHIYGFNRIQSGIDKGAYYHELFVADNRSLCLRMVRQKIKGTSSKHESDQPDPDFYSTILDCPHRMVPKRANTCRDTDDFARSGLFASWPNQVVSRNESRDGNAFWVETAQRIVSTSTPTLLIRGPPSNSAVCSFPLHPEREEQTDEDFFAGKRFFAIMSAEDFDKGDNPFEPTPIGEPMERIPLGARSA